LHEVLLHIETSSGICSVAVSQHGELLNEQVELEHNRAGERLHLMINAALDAAGKDFKDLDAVCVSGGPGSYTGLRIGVSAAKGICFARNVPLIHIESFQAMQYAVRHRLKQEADCYIGLIDARRMDAYTAVMDTEGNCLSPPEAITLLANSFEEFLKRKSCLLMGTAVQKFLDLNPGFSGKQVPFSELLASDTISLSYHKFVAKSFENLFYYEPLYYKAVFLAKN
jgi:tRNA threonylcarbamoyladenosine biosynthesis protein TsaB